MGSDPANRLGETYARYGPGRLPGGDRRDVGGGYAFATTMAVFCLVYFSNSIVGVGWTSPQPVFFEDIVLALITWSLIEVCGFVGGYLTWRYLPEQTPHFGVVAGGTASVLTHGLIILVVDVIVIVNIGYLEPLEKLTAIITDYAGLFIILSTDFLDVLCVLYLVGLAGGYAYEQIRL